MNQKKSCASRIAAMLLSLVMLVGLLPSAAFAAEAPDYKFGTAQTVLTPGKYNLPVSMMNADKPDNPSMAAAAVQGGELEVKENGDAFVTIQLGPVTMMFLTGWSKDWKIYSEYNTQSALTPAEVVSRDDKNHETAIRFKLPYTDQDGVYAKMSVDVGMSMSPDALLKMDFAKAETVKTGTAAVAFGSEKAYDVTAEVTVQGGRTITGVALSHNAAESGHADSVSYADSAKGMAEKFNSLSATDAAAIQGVDVVSGATVTSGAYKEAVLKALGLYEAPKPSDFGFGSADTRLAPGEYQVSVALMNSGKHEKPSMAASAFAPAGLLTVSQEGVATLTLDMQAVTIGMGPVQITDMAHTVLVYQADNCNDGTATVAAQVLKTTAKPEPMPGAGREVPTQISFTLPNNSWDGVYLNFTVDAMGPGYPDGWLKIDFAQAKAPGEVEVKTGSAKVDQFGKYTIDANVSVKDGVISNVDVSARDFISATHKDTNDMKIAQVAKALKSAWNGIAPTQANAEEIFYKIMQPENHDEVIDTVSGATYSAKAVRDAVMNAFGLEYQDEIINVPEKVEPGVYQVEVGYYSDVVYHSLVENPKTMATLTVGADGAMTLDFETKSGTEKEPLYILGFNGVYENNDLAGELTLEGSKAVMGLSSNDYQDEFFPKGTQVVNHLTFPLLGGLNKVYNTNCRLYVPAMKALNGEMSGIMFENGTFSANVFAKVYWDTMQKVPEPQVVKTGTVDITMNMDGKDKTSMCDVMFDGKAGVQVLDNDMARLEFLVVNPVPASPDDGKDGTLKNFTVTYQGRQYAAESQLGTGRMMTAKNDSSIFGLQKGQQYPAQVLTVTLPAAALNETKLITGAYVNVVMNSNQNFVMVLSNLTLEGVPEPVAPAAPVIQPASAEFTDAVEVTISAEKDAVIRYTTDGTEPTVNSTEYTAPIRITETATVKAIAVRGELTSPVAEAVYTKKAAEPQKPVLAEGSYMVPVAGLVSAAPLPPVKAAFANAFGSEIRLDVAADGRMTATIIPQHMVVDMAENGRYHCNVLTVEGGTYPEMKTELLTPTFGTPETTQEVQCPAVIVVPMPAANEKGGYVFTITVDFMNCFLGQGLENDHPTDVTLTLDFANARKIEETQKIEDGNYYVPVYLWHATKDQASMGDMAMESNRKVLVTVKDGKVTEVQAATSPVNMAGFVSGVTSMTVNGEPVTVQKTGKMTTQMGNEYDYLKNFKFAMPEEGQPAELNGCTYVPVAFVVPDTPMGADPIEARMKFDWAAAELTQDTELEANGDITTDNEPVKLVHEGTGVKLDSNTLVIPALSRLDVEKVASGAGYDKAVEAMDGLTGWELYHIAAVAKDQEIAPNGQVTLSIPCGPDGLEVYRIDGEDGRVLVRGQVKNGYYVFSTSQLGDFAITGRLGIAFRDLPDEHWSHDFVIRAVELDLFSGYPNGMFGPDDAMNRAMFITVLGKLAGVDKASAEMSSFSDVDPDAFYAPYVVWAEKAGITAGVGGNKFDPEGKVTREQMAVFLVRYCEYAGIELKDGQDVVFNDEDQIHGFAADAVAQAVRGGLLSGLPGNIFAPMMISTRAQAATVLVSLVENYSLK